MDDQGLPTLTAREVSTMRWFKKNLADHYCTGTRKIVTMQRLAAHGLVKPIYEQGMIADWQITDAGKTWDQ